MYSLDEIYQRWAYITGYHPDHRLIVVGCIVILVAIVLKSKR